MKSKELQIIERLLNVKFQKKQKIFLKVVADENRLRSQLTQIDDQSRAVERSNFYEIRAIGADVVWNSWVERSKRNINMELAQVLAQKDQLKSKVKNDYGKVLVSGELKNLKRSQETNTLQKKNLEAAIQTYLSLRKT